MPPALLALPPLCLFSRHWGSSWAGLESSHHRVRHPVAPKHPFLSPSEAWEEVRSRPALLGCIQNQRMGGHFAGDQGRVCSVSAVKEVQGVAGGGGGGGLLQRGTRTCFALAGSGVIRVHPVCTPGSLQGQANDNRLLGRRSQSAGQIPEPRSTPKMADPGGSGTSSLVKLGVLVLPS